MGERMTFESSVTLPIVSMPSLSLEKVINLQDVEDGAQRRGGQHMAFGLSPILAIVVGILVLVFPKLFRIILGIYLILSGLLGLI